MEFNLVAATEDDKPVLRRLIELYRPLAGPPAEDEPGRHGVLENGYPVWLRRAHHG
ncbi:MAG: hypothetical protein ACYCZV_01020 [Acidimicrobiales bacterium]